MKEKILDTFVDSRALRTRICSSGPKIVISASMTLPAQRWASGLPSSKRTCDAKVLSTNRHEPVSSQFCGWQRR